MRKNIQLSAVFIGLAIIFGSCEKLFLADDPENDPVSNFEYLWQEANNKYSYFEYKSVDWDAVYDTYRPLMQQGFLQCLQHVCTNDEVAA